MNRQERIAAVAELRLIASRAHYLSQILPTLTSKEEHDQCVAEFQDLCERYRQLDREDYQRPPVWWPRT
jgi:hypothetical protein